MEARTDHNPPVPLEISSLDVRTRRTGFHGAGFRLRTILEAYLFLLPSFIGLLVFLLLPIIAVAVLSLFNWGLLSTPKFIGLQNYNTLIHSQVMWHSLFVTIYYVLLNIPAQTVIALLLALLMNKKLPGIGIFRTLFVVPWMATPVAMGIVWQWIFSPQYGSLNTFLAFFGIHGPAWLTSLGLALPSVAAVNIWQYVGYNMLFFLAGVQGIPEYLYEAAHIDGASPVRAFFQITLPLLNPTLFFVLVTDIIGSFQVFDTVFVMTNGGPEQNTTTFNFLLYREAFQYFHTGYAAALSMVLFVIIAAVTLIQALYFRNRTVYDLS
jgi:multiple sugar transport system permease protein/sn-glycerol 3-phosphate transport system permease protein